MTIFKATDKTNKLKGLLELTYDTIDSNPELCEPERLKGILKVIADNFLPDYHIHTDQFDRLNELLELNFNALTLLETLGKIDDCFCDIIAIADAEISHFSNIHKIALGLTWEEFDSQNLTQKCELGDIPELNVLQQNMVRNYLWNQAKRERILL
jgi:hypothetical protein